MYMTIRTYRVGKGSIDEVMHRVDRDLAEAFAQEPGFIAYQVARTGDRRLRRRPCSRIASRARPPTSLRPTGWRTPSPTSRWSGWASWAAR